MGIDYHFLGIHITYINGAVLVLVFASLIQIGVTVLFVSNLSKDYDPKGEVERAMRKKAEDEFILLINDEEHNKAQTPDNFNKTWIFFKSLIKHKQIVLILVFSGFHIFCVRH